MVDLHSSIASNLQAVVTGFVTGDEERRHGQLREQLQAVVTGFGTGDEERRHGQWREEQWVAQRSGRRQSMSPTPAFAADSLECHVMVFDTSLFCSCGVGTSSLLAL